MNEEHFLEVQALDNSSAVIVMKATKLLLACIVGDYSIGEELARDVPNWPAEGFSLPILVGVYCYSGVSIAANGGNRHRKSVTAVKKFLRKLKQAVRNSAGRYDPQVYILEAEVAGLKGKTDLAVSKFELAADLAKQDGLLILMGLARERASAVLANAGRHEESRAYLKGAFVAFQSWGAEAKVTQIALRLSDTGAGGKPLTVEDAAEKRVSLGSQPISNNT